ncbi:MAG: AraC family transcriptional regulator [Chitinophagaceae bacterium]
MKKGQAENTIFIKNMVCNRCIAAVKKILDDASVSYQSVSLGEVSVQQPVSAKQNALLQTKLAEAGFLLLDDNKSKIIGKIKTIIIELIHHNDAEGRHNLSEILSTRLHKDYSLLSRLFSEVEGITIEKYAINQRIEKIKELLAYDELNLNEIAFQLGYSSVAHLSAQFKKVTGLTPSYFKKSRNLPRKPLDDV